MRQLSASTALLAAASLSLACSSSDEQPEQNENPAEMREPPEMDPGMTEPPGTQPPNGAVECEINSGFPGDEFCILPPDPEEGIQLHVGPSDYDDPDAVAPYVLARGENVVCYNDRAEDGGFFYFEQKNRMRSGSHHMLIGLSDAEGREEGPTAQCDTFSRNGSIPGSQTPRRDVVADTFGPEDQGLARWFPEDQMASFQLHYVNTTGEPVLREAWVNLYKKDPREVETALNTVFLVGDIAVNIPPQTRQTTRLSFAPNLPERTRLFELNGHSHAHNERFSAWRNRGQASEELLYESYNWEEPDVLRFNSVAKNPAPDPIARTDGGVSGMQYLEPGDTLSWECEVNNTTDAPLRFANEAYTAEMCLLSGSYVSDLPGLLSGVCIGGSCLGGGATTSSLP